MTKFITTVLIALSTIQVLAQKPSIPGGLETFVKNNTVYPPYAKKNCIQGTVNISFKLNNRGEVYYSAVSKGIGADLDDEALRLVKMSSKKWTVPSSHDTTAVLVVPINFSLNGYDCERKTNAEIALAINAYKNYDELFDVIQNYYKSKEKGAVKPGDEAKILLLKRELGIDETYLDERISSALNKYNQGDKKGACEELTFVKNMGSTKADEWLAKYCN